MVNRKALFTLAIILMLNARSFAAVPATPILVPFNQSMGLINIPTANILKHGVFRLTVNAAVFSVGVFDHFEIGALLFGSGYKLCYGHRLGIKLIDEIGYFPALAVGTESISGDPRLAAGEYSNSSYEEALK